MKKIVHVIILQITLSHILSYQYIHFSRMVKSNLRVCKEDFTMTNFFLNLYNGGWNPRSTRHCGHQWPIVPALGDYDDGGIGGMIGMGNRSTWRKPAPVPLCPPQTPHAAQMRTRAAVVGSQRLNRLSYGTALP
jgi:hypothetical protein